MKTLLDRPNLHIFLLDSHITVDTRLGRSIQMPLADFIVASNTLSDIFDDSPPTAPFISEDKTPTIEIDDGTAEKLRALSESESDDGNEGPPAHGDSLG